MKTPLTAAVAGQLGRAAIAALALALAHGGGLAAEADQRGTPAGAARPPLAAVADYRPVAGGTLRSVLPADGATADAVVTPFLLRSRPVTNAEFAAFLHRAPEWQRGQAPQLFTSASYLQGWQGSTDHSPLAADAPVVRVSWYAAQAYCASEGARLPRWYEWEFAAAADATRADARDDPAWLASILNWYADAGKNPPHSVAAGTPNLYGIHDLHGLVWEWVEDYNGLLVNADSRAKGEQKLLDYCGGAAVSLADRRNYAILMRLALLAAMEASQDGANLGFRCARDPAPNEQGPQP